MSTIRRTPELWEALYDNFWFDLLTRYIRPLVQRGSSHKLRILMEAFQPDAIICTQAHPFAVLSAYAKRQSEPIPIWGVITDFLPHRFWYVQPNKHIHYVVPTDTAVQRLMILGIPAEQIHTLGIPIQADILAARHRTISRTNGHDGRRVLVMGGSRGLGARFKTIKQLDRTPGDFTIDVVTGTNRKLRKQLLRARHKFTHPIRIRGYVKDAMALMSRASLLIGKPGGLTSAEAMASGTPMILIRPLPGQERGNTEMLVRHGAAIEVDRDRDLPGVVSSLLAKPALIEMMAARAKTIGKPFAARDIAAAMFDSLPPEGAE
jgi:processive 1,2-diacylglycerol beta-glucosyltransferase